MWFAILGPLRVSRDGEAVPVGGPKQRALLTLLLLRANRVSTTDWLVDALWDGAPPPSAEVTLRTYVAALRRALEPGRGARAQGRILVGHDGGYELRVAGDAIDAVRFTELSAAGARALAEGDPVAAERHYTQALTLWRGDPAAGDLAAVRAETARLAETRLAAEEGRCTAAVAAGRHLAVLPDLRCFVAEQPAREAARGQLMLALYRAGQQTEALAVYDEGRRFLASEFGVEPTAELRALHRQILGHTVPCEAPPPRGLVGRSAELEALAAHLDGARHHSGGGRMVAVVGEAGIGKTTLAAAVADRAAAAGIPVVWGRCPDVGQAPPFWLWSQVVRGLLALPHTEDVAALAGFVEGRSPEDGGPDPAARFRAYDAVSELIRAAAGPAGLLLVLDDVHAADPDSLLLTRYLTTTVHTGRALVLATLRPYEHDPGLVATLNDLARGRGSGQLRLGGLDPAGVADLVADRTGGPAPDDLVRRLADRTGGNPFFLTELLAAPERPLPPSVRDAVRIRLDGPDPAARECLDVLSVAGRELDLHLLRAVTGTDAAQLLAGPGAARLVTEAGPGTVRFRHALLAEVTYAELPPPRRATLHARLAGAAADRGGLAAGEIAHHYGQSIGLGHAADFLRWTVRAADDAARRLAYEDALAHLGRAADHLAPDAATSPEAAATELGVQLRRASLLQITVGVGSDAVAEAAARARWLLPYTGPDTDVSTALWTLGEVACNRAEYAVAEDLAQRLTRAVTSDDELIAAAGPYLLGVVCYFTGRLGEADGHLSTAVQRLAAVDPRQLREQAGRTPALAAYNFRALVRSLLGDAGAARADIDAAAALAERGDDAYGRANAALYAAWTALQEHDVAAGRDAARRCREIGARQRMPHFVTTGDFVAEWAAVRGGEHGRLAAMRAAGEAIHRLGLRATLTISIAAMADAHLVAGDPATAARLAAAGLEAAATAGEQVLTAELRRVRGLANGDDEDVRAGAGIAAAQGARLLLARIAQG
ncbi:BTAD domain-containing putative transcriptional regulator [Dactylosporangium siamense]|uniref:OmpR/PhoB-type domain-containing protein n=1 Tax=Dactylosporangium siamense TaxID=685454 RepID=A0A919PNP7_9ACTN|nr:BTAD domain-containing putative transcriptional regulator [Dactylosporangium siamense]GIG45725.1 hypothetical protein Dsi01nite_037660 [Dactylosporangium siamense]